MNFRNYLAGTILFSLLIWGPINYSLTGWFIIRIGYIILIPLLTWFLIAWIWDKFEPSKKMESILTRILSGLISAVILLMSIFTATATEHRINTKWVQTGSGTEAVGNNILIPGSAWGEALLLFGISICFFWYGVLTEIQKNKIKKYLKF